MDAKQEARTLKEALYRTVHHNPRLNVEQIAEHLDIDPNYLYRQLLPDPDTDGPRASGARFMIKLLIPLVRVTKDFQAVDFIERQLGRVAVPIPDLAQTTIMGIQEAAIDSSAEFGQMMVEMRDSLCDSHLDKKERERIIAAGWDAIQAIMRVIMSFKDGAK